METLKTSETLDKVLVSPEVGQGQNPCEKTLEEIYGLSIVDTKGPGSVSPSVASVREIGSWVDSGNKGEVSTNGISLFVEVFGPLNSHVRGDDFNCSEKHVLVENNSNQENGENVNGELLLENGNTSAKSGYEGEGGAVGDFVWAKTNTQLWWPGIICDASNAPKDVAKSEQKDCLLIRCFGNGSFVWLPPCHMKPFLEYFEQMSRQSNSKSFLVALEKAVAEVGRCVKMELTCSCFGKKLEDKRADLGELSVTQFEPASFVSFIKHIAQDVSVPNQIDCTVVKNRVSAFYRAIGHKQIPMHQLKPASDDAKDSARAELTSGVSEGTVLEKKAERSTNVKSEKDYESRERRKRKSRFLSPPYVNLSLGRKGSPISGEHETEDFKTVPHAGVDMKSTNGQSVGPASMVKCNGKKSWKKWSKKPITGHYTPGKLVQINASSAEVLSVLRFTALDCLYPNENKIFVSVERFLSRFRRMAFHDFTSEIANERTIGQEFDHEIYPHQTLPELEVRSDIGMGMEKVIDTQVQPLPDVLLKRGRKKKETTSSSDSKTYPNPFLSDFKRNITTCGSVMIDFQNVVPLASEAQCMPKKRKKSAKANQGLQQIEVMVDISDMNRNSTILNFGDSQVTGPPQGKPEPKRRRKKEGDTSKRAKIAGLPDVNGDGAGIIPILKEVQLVGLFSIQTTPELNNLEGIKESAGSHLNTEVTSGQPDVTGRNSVPQMDILSPGGKPEPKKRGRKRKALDLQTNASMIPDLNGNAAEGKPQKRRRRNKNNAEGGIPCINLSYNNLQNNGEASGAALLLKFAPGHSVPSKEDLVSVFSGFGPLKEAETQILNNSESAQVVFVSSANAGEAFRSLEKSSPFGPALVNYRLHHLPDASRAAIDGLKTPIKLPVLKPHQGEAPDLACIRKNLEMMTSMLEKAGGNLSPEMRAKLESEIKGLLKKVSNMVGSSSSS